MEASRLPWRPLGALLVEHGVVRPEQLELALAEQAETGERLGDILVRRGVASRYEILDAIAVQSGVLFEPERGFGTGLRDELVRRDREQREVVREDGPAPAPADETLEEALRRARAHVAARRAGVRSAPSG